MKKAIFILISTFVSMAAQATTCAVIQHPDFFADQFKISCSNGRSGENAFFWGHQKEKVAQFVSDVSQSEGMVNIGECS